MSCCVNGKTVFDIIPYTSLLSWKPSPSSGRLLQLKTTSGNLSLKYWRTAQKFSICRHNSSMTSNTTGTWDATRNSKRHNASKRLWRNAKLNGARFENTGSGLLFSALPPTGSPSFPSAQDTHWADATHCHSSEINGLLACTCSPQLLSRCTLPGTLGTGEAAEREGFISLFPITGLHPKPFLLLYTGVHGITRWQHNATWR